MPDDEGREDVDGEAMRIAQVGKAQELGAQ